jgi:glutaredoxin
MDHDPIRVALYTIPGHCPLCDTARQVLTEMGLKFGEIDIRSDRGLLRAYRNEIPVVTVDGVKRFIGRVDVQELREFLGTPPQSSESDA